VIKKLALDLSEATDDEIAWFVMVGYTVYDQYWANCVYKAENGRYVVGGGLGNTTVFDHLGEAVARFQGADV
jgi:hypothetical protein